MGVFYETIPPSLQTWIKEQKVFWVATAPLSAQGHVNLSPKGGPYFGLVDDHTFWFMDLSGSGSETIAHIYEPGNGRVTIMFNAFDGPPKIVRLYGKGTVLESPSAPFASFIERHSISPIPGTRSIILVSVSQVGSSCGFSVPYYKFDSFRPILNDHFAKKEARFLEGNEKESIDRYWAFKNAWSVDELPAMKRGLDVARKEGIKPVAKMKAKGKGNKSNFFDEAAGGLKTVMVLVAVLMGGFALGLAVGPGGGTGMMMNRWSDLQLQQQQQQQQQGQGSSSSSNSMPRAAYQSSGGSGGLVGGGGASTGE